MPSRGLQFTQEIGDAIEAPIACSW